MPSISQGLVFATAMVVSSTLLFLAYSYSRHKSFPLPRLSKNQNSQQPEKKILRSCLLSGIHGFLLFCSSLLFFFSFIMVLNVCPFLLLLLEEKKKERKKKKVQFAEDVKEPSGNGEEYRKECIKLSKDEMSCRNKIPTVNGMPENRIALYDGILKDRMQRMQCS